MKKDILFLVRCLVLAVMMATGIAAQAKPAKKKQTAPQLTTLEIIEKVNNTWQKNHSHNVRAFWDDAAYFTGDMEAYRLTGKAQWMEFARKWADYNDWKGAKSNDRKKWKYRHYGEGHDFVLFGDWQICFQTYMDLYEIQPDDYKVERAIDVMSHECALPQNDFWWWADALYMVMPVMTKMYKMTGNVKYLDKLYDNFLYSDSLMFDAEAKLYFRDGKYIYPKHKTDLGKKDFWARGDGWVLAGLAKVLADMPADYKHRALFVQRYKQLAEGVASCQQPDGYWTRSMMDPEQAEGPETSGTAFFAYGLYWGINHGYLDADKYKPVADRAWHYLSTKALQPDGRVGYVQPIGEKAIKGQQLTPANEANFGTGAFLLAACERLRNEYRQAYGRKIILDIFSDSVTIVNANLIEVDAKNVCKQLGIPVVRMMRFYDSRGVEQPYQITHDGHILVMTATNPNVKKSLTVVVDDAPLFKSVACGRHCNERLDDISFENDHLGFRIYGPALAHAGQDACGYDLWMKEDARPCLDFLYHRESVCQPKVRAWRKQGQKAKADSLNTLTSYHIDQGRGCDIYAVGRTLGCGASALLADGDLKLTNSYSKYEILDNGPLRFSVRLDFSPVVHNGDSVVEHRMLTLDKGSRHCSAEVWYDNMTKPFDWAAGVVVRDNTMPMKIEQRYVEYTDPTQTNDSFIRTSAWFDGVESNGKETNNVLTGYLDTKKRNGAEGHLLGIYRNVAPNAHIYYRFGAKWSKHE